MILARFLAAISLALIASPASAALPVANAHADDYDTRYVQVLTPVTLDGSGSYGVGCELSYSWRLVSRPPLSISVLFSANTAQPHFIPDRAGDYVFELVVADSSGTSEPERVTVSAIAGSPWLHARNSDRWMELTPGLMERTLPQISLPGTHDAGAYWLSLSSRGPDFIVWNDDWEWVTSDEFENKVAYDITKTQDHTFLEQLNGGIRYFDLRVTLRDGVFHTYHGLLGRPLTEIFADVRAFLEQSPHELVVIMAGSMGTGTNRGNDVPFTPAEHHAFMQFLVDELGDYLYPSNGRAGSDLVDMTLGEIVADGSKVLLDYNGTYGNYNFTEDPAYAADPNSAWFWVGHWSRSGYTNTTRMYDTLPCPRDEPAGERGQFNDQRCKALLHAERPDERRGFSLFQTLTANADVARHNACERLLPDAVCGSPSTLRQLSRTVNPNLRNMLDAIDWLRPSVIMVDHYQESAVVTEAIRLNHIDIDAPQAEVTREPAANRYGGSFDDVTVTLTASDEKHGSGVAGIAYSIEGAQGGGAVICGAEAKFQITAKGSSRVTYTVIDKEGNESEPTAVDVRINQRCDFNGDHKLDSGDRRGLLESLFNFSKYAAVGDLDADGRLTSQEWVRCFYMIPR